MGETSGIAWTHGTFNPWWGCQKVSPACGMPMPGHEGEPHGECYALTLDARFPILGQTHWGKDAPRRFFGDKHWAEPLKWNRKAEKEGARRRIFCGSMCDVMEDREDLHPHRERLYKLIEATPMLDWLLLTKRPQNFRRFLPKPWLESPRPNVWGMATVESDEYHWRAWELLKTPFAIRGLSVEPLLGPFDLDRWELICKTWRRGLTIGIYLDFVIVGGESGRGARHMDLQWVRTIRDQCASEGVPFFMKQLSQADSFRDYEKFEAFPPDLQVRQMPETTHA